MILGSWVRDVGLLASIALPFFNLPLMFGIVKRRSSKDISISWALGVWTCLLLILPTALTSVDMVFQVFSCLNLILFSGVVALVLYYRQRE